MFAAMASSHCKGACGISAQVTEGYNGFCYVYEGSGTIGGASASPQTAMVMGPGASSSRHHLMGTSIGFQSYQLQSPDHSGGFKPLVKATRMVLNCGATCASNTCLHSAQCLGTPQLENPSLRIFRGPQNSAFIVSLPGSCCEMLRTSLSLVSR